MTSKLLEIRDRATFIPALAIRVSGHDGYLMRRAGYDHPLIILIHLQHMRCAYDPYDWLGSRTMCVAHQWIEKHWNELRDSDVVDIEFILGESTTKKESEQFSHPHENSEQD